ncbi:MAG TPA: pectin acetylesterase-family hydrolase, partial [Thermoanaerobaculia bacterium]|nr:pectin acetylesterase-family hydrolase [Thermoanaerobaculia bacterium]
ACQSDLPGQPQPPPPGPVANLEGLAAGWNPIEPGGETVCSDGTPYKFFARPGDPAKLVVYFQGGGGCFDARTCDPDVDPTYTVNLAELDLSRYHGIFAFDHAENPFADASFVFAPYCTADVHIGNRVASYQAPESEGHAAHEVTIHHRGARNAAAVLQWTYERFFRPESVFVAGSSAGSIPSPYYALHIARRYPEARVAQLGDGAGGYRGIGSGARPHQEWGTLAVVSDVPELAALGPEEFTFESLYIAAAKNAPHVTFAEYDTAEDSVQLRFLELGGTQATTLQPLLEANHADIRAAAPANFRAYVAGGDLHTILARPEFYTYHVGGERVRDWVAALADGDEIEDVRCTDCKMAEVLEPPASEAVPGTEGQEPADMPSGTGDGES